MSAIDATASAYLKKGIMHHFRNRFEEAYRHYLKALKQKSQCLKCFFLLSAVEVQKGRKHHAAQWFKKAYNSVSFPDQKIRRNVLRQKFVESLHLDPHPEATYRGLGQALSETGDLKLAACVLESGLSINPKDPDGYEALGTVADQLSDHNTAVTSFKMAVRLKPQKTDLYFKLGNSLNRLGEPRQALEAYTQVLSRGEHLAAAHNNIGLTLHRLGRDTKARRHFEEALRIQPANSTYCYNLGNLLVTSGKITDAVREFEKATLIDPDFGQAWINLADILKRQGDYFRAVNCYRQALICLPDCEQVHYNLGLTLHALGRPNEACRHFKKAVELDPSNSGSLHMLNALLGKDVDQAPDGYVKNLFDRYAQSFDNHMNGRLSYSVPRWLKKQLKLHCRRRGGFNHLLDLGCGTGLSGVALKDMATYKTGVDVSTKMLAVAENKRVYDTLICCDICEFLSVTDECFDLVTAADVLIYFGELTDLFGLVRKRLAVGGLFAFSSESGTVKDYRLQKNGRFAHAPDYIHREAKNVGLTTVSECKIGIRMENELWVRGRLTILQAV